MYLLFKMNHKKELSNITYNVINTVGIDQLIIIDQMQYFHREHHRPDWSTSDLHRPLPFGPGSQHWGQHSTSRSHCRSSPALRCRPVRSQQTGSGRSRNCQLEGCTDCCCTRHCEVPVLNRPG